MKALVIDCAVTRLIVAAKNDDDMCAAVYDIGMKQSETIVNAVDYVLEKAGITAKELDYTCVTGGPGSFTGLRLGFSVLKALTLANGTPLYAISSLKIHAWPYMDSELPLLCGISAYFMLEYNSRRELNTARFWKANFRTNFVKNLEIRQYSFGFFLVIAKIFALQNC